MCCPTLCSGRENSRVVSMRFLKVVKTKKSGPRKRLEDGKLCFPRFLGPRRVGESDWVVVGLAVTVLLLFLFSPRCCLGKVHTK